LQKVKEDERKKQEKRTTNIRERTQLKQDRKQFGKKKALQMMKKKRPGFEGSSSRKR
jgi:hypothetical protein